MLEAAVRTDRLIILSFADFSRLTHSVAGLPLSKHGYSSQRVPRVPWAFIAKPLGIDLGKFPAVAAWRERIKSRAAVQLAINLHKEAQFTKTASTETAKALFNQDAKAVLVPRAQ